MSNEPKIRLNKAAREFKVGFTTIVEFLEKKGFKIENSPSAQLDGPMLEALQKEFGGKGVEGINVREKIKQKNESVSLGEMPEKARRDEDDFEPELVIKSGTMHIDKPVVKGPTILGKIDLDAKNRPVEPKAPVEAKTPSTSPVVKQAEPAAVKQAVPAPVEAKTPQPSPTAKQAVPAPVEIKVPETSPVIKEAVPPVVKQAESAVQTKTYDERQAEKPVEIFRPDNGATGPKVVDCPLVHWDFTFT